MGLRNLKHRIAPVLIAVLASASLGYASHPDLEMRIEIANQHIEQSPHDAQLYFERGQLNMQHEDWDGAIADFERVLQLDPEFNQARVARGVALFKAGWVRTAKVVLDAYLIEFPEDSTALLTRGRAQSAVGNHLLAAQDLNRVVPFLSDPKPDFYLELAREYELAGVEYFIEALNAVDLGIERFGPLMTLELYALEIEIKLAHVDQALERLDLVMDQSQRKERFLVQRGEILEAAHRTDEAKQAYEAGLEAIEKLPLRIQRNKSTKALHTKAHAALARIGQLELDDKDSIDPAIQSDD